VITNLLWVRSHRERLPFDIDEAGYLQRAIRDGDALRHGGLTGFWHAFRVKDPQAPLLPMAAGLWREITNVGPVGMIAAEQVFVAIAIVSTFLIARRLGVRLVPALIAAGCAAALPRLVTDGRSFAFAVPATAFFTATLASQLAAGDFKRRRPAIVWGLLLGIATLTRTVMLALLPALVLAVLVRLVLVRARPRQWVNLAFGLVVATLAAATWYTATWRPVWDYLTNYGYGQKSASYGHRWPILSWSRWTYRIVNASNNDLLLPFTIAGAVCLVVLAARAVSLRSVWVREPVRVATEFLRTTWGTVTLVLVVDYVVLSSTRNTGSDFELTLLPAAVALLVSGASLCGRIGRTTGLAAATVAAVFSLVAANGLLPGGPKAQRITVGSLNPVVYDDRGSLLYYSTRFLPQPLDRIEPALRTWQTAANRMTDTLFREGAERHKPIPVVFFAVQDPFVNTNSVALRAQQRGISLPVGLLLPRTQAGEPLAAQLQDPARGVPDVVVIGPPSANDAAAAFSPLSADEMPAARAAARADGFHLSGSVTLPDGRGMQLWWRSAP
jgi:hypothetical protein